MMVPHGCFFLILFFDVTWENPLYIEKETTTATTKAEDCDRQGLTHRRVQYKPCGKRGERETCWAKIITQIRTRTKESDAHTTKLLSSFSATPLSLSLSLVLRCVLCCVGRCRGDKSGMRNIRCVTVCAIRAGVCVCERERDFSGGNSLKSRGLLDRSTTASTLERCCIHF